MILLFVTGSPPQSGRWCEHQRYDAEHPPYADDERTRRTMQLHREREQDCIRRSCPQASCCRSVGCLVCVKTIQYAHNSCFCFANQILANCESKRQIDSHVANHKFNIDVMQP